MSGRGRCGGPSWCTPCSATSGAPSRLSTGACGSKGLGRSAGCGDGAQPRPRSALGQDGNELADAGVVEGLELLGEAAIDVLGRQRAGKLLRQCMSRPLELLLEL